MEWVGWLVRNIWIGHVDRKGEGRWKKSVNLQCNG
jgi:hypothetical protein